MTGLAALPMAPAGMTAPRPPERYSVRALVYCWLCFLFHAHSGSDVHPGVLFGQ